MWLLLSDGVRECWGAVQKAFDIEVFESVKERELTRCQTNGHMKLGSRNKVAASTAT